MDRPLLILAGGRGEGKTFACLALARRAAALGAKVGGLVSAGERGADGIPREIGVQDLATGERRLLARRGADLGGPSWPRAAPGAPAPGAPAAAGDPSGFAAGGPRGAAAPFGFSAASIAWAIERAERALSGRFDLVVVDEIGPLELELGLGFLPLLASIAGRDPGTAALLTVRPSLAERLAAELRRAGGPEGESPIVALGSLPRGSPGEALAERLLPETRLPL